MYSTIREVFDYLSDEEISDILKECENNEVGYISNDRFTYFLMMGLHPIRKRQSVGYLSQVP